MRILSRGRGGCVTLIFFLSQTLLKSKSEGEGWVRNPNLFSHSNPYKINSLKPQVSKPSFLFSHKSPKTSPCLFCMQ